MTESRLLKMTEGGSHIRLDGNGQPAPVRAQTLVIGDTNQKPNRLRGGSGHNIFGGNGGFLAGDRYPSTTPWTRTGAPQTDRLPLIVWQGELVKDQTAVMVIPTIWEWDDTPGLLDTLSGIPILRALDSATAILASGMLAGGGVQSARDVGLGSAPGGETTVRRSLIGDKKDRPIGMEDSSNRSVYEFMPKLITFTYNLAEAALNSNPVGRGAGVFEINYRDNNDLRGDYTLYLQIERIP